MCVWDLDLRPRDECLSVLTGPPREGCWEGRGSWCRMKAGLGGRGRVQESGPIVRRQQSFRIEGEGEKAEKERHSWAAVRERAWPHKLELKAQSN